MASLVSFGIQSYPAHFKIPTVESQNITNKNFLASVKSERSPSDLQGLWGEEKLS